MKTRAVWITLALVGLLARLPQFLPAAGAPGGQNPFAGLEEAAKEKAAEEGITTLLNNQLPLDLNAKNIYPTVQTLPGGPFQPTPLKLTADDVDTPLQPGDYAVSTLAFCSEYSVHRPGAGVAYVIGPISGKAADAISNLLWRGTIQYNIAPTTLQAVSWSIQSGLTYTEMPKSYQAVVDQVIPDFKNEIASDFMTNVEGSYNNYAKTLKMPSLDQIFAKSGKPGELALSAERQRAALTRQNTNDQIKEQTLFQGQETGVYAPVKEDVGPWTEKIPGVGYMKLQIVGGNMASNNVMLIRVMPSAVANLKGAADFHLAAFRSSGRQYPTPRQLATLKNFLFGTIGYSEGEGAQALAQVPIVSAGRPSAQGPAPGAPQGPTAVGKVSAVSGTVIVTRNGVMTALKAGDQVFAGDVIQTGAGSSVSIQLNNGVPLNLGANSSITI